MRKFLRFLMLLVVAVCWAGVSQAKSVHISGLDCKNAGASGKNSFTCKGFTFSVSSGTFGIDTPNTGGEYLKIPSKANFTITSPGGNMVYFFISFCANLGDDWGDHYGAEKFESWTTGEWIKKNEHTGIKHEGWKISKDTYYSNGYWTGDSKAVTFYTKNPGPYIFWFDIAYGEAASESTTAPSIAITSTDNLTESNSKFPFDGYTKGSKGSTGYSISTNTSGATIHYKIGTADWTTSTSTITGTVAKTTVISAYVTTTEHMKETASEGTIDERYVTTTSPSITKTFEKYWDVNVATGSNGTYGTLAHDNYMTVPTGFTASTYYIANSNTKVRYLTHKTTFSAGQVVPPNWAVVVARVSGSSTSAHFTNPTNDSGSTPTADGNVLSGNFTYAAATASDNASKNFYYLMKEASGNSRIGFFWGAKSTDGKRGVPISLAPHKAYFAYDKSKTSGAKALTVIMPPSDGFSTGIDEISVEADTDDNTPMYNTAGQRVGASYKGIVIQNGRKFIKK